MAKISFIIPCYNSEKFLNETLLSVSEQNFSDWEAIIINDGSIDATENIAKTWVDRDNRFKYYSKKNEGLGKTRNYGIARANGIYILPLDSDNVLRKDFIVEAVNVFERNSHIGVVYGDANYIGEKKGLWRVGEFNSRKMLYHNYIDACALIRKRLFDLLGGYDEHLPYQGHEDWEFWLRVIKSDYRFYYLKKVSFDYRVTNDSMIRSFTVPMLEKNMNYIRAKHSELLAKEYCELYRLYRVEKEESDRLRKKIDQYEKVFKLPFIKRVYGILKNK